MRFRINFRFPVVLSVLFLAGLITISFGAIPCQASVKGSEPPVFSLDVKDQPLGKVLEKVSRITGYEITVNKEGLDFPVTASFRNVSVYEGLRRILGTLNHSIISNDKEKRISVVIIAKDIQKKTKGRVSAQKEIGPLDMEVTPPLRPGERGMTLRELNALNSNREQIDPLDMEVTPPVRSGERGVTLRELKAMESQIDPLDHEVTPPVRPGERSMTLGELNALETQRQKIDPLDHEVTPPLRPGERGMTVRELNALESQRQKIDPLDYELTPP